MNTERLSLTQLHKKELYETYNRTLDPRDERQPAKPIGREIVPTIGNIITTKSGKVCMSSIKDNADIPKQLTERIQQLYVDKPLNVQQHKVAVTGNIMNTLVNKKQCEDVDCRNWSRKM